MKQKKKSTIITRKKKHYVNNAQFLELITKDIEARKPFIHIIKSKDKEFKKKNLHLVPPISNETALAIYSICKRYANSARFNNYTYKEEMIAEAVCFCLGKVDNFNPEVSNNPFSYFTQITHFVFFSVINREEKNTYVNFKEIGTFLQDESSVDTELYTALFQMKYGDEETHSKLNTFVANYEKRLEEKKEQQRMDHLSKKARLF